MEEPVQAWTKAFRLHGTCSNPAHCGSFDALDHKRSTRCSGEDVAGAGQEAPTTMACPSARVLLSRVLTCDILRCSGVYLEGLSCVIITLVAALVATVTCKSYKVETESEQKEQQTDTRVASSFCRPITTVYLRQRHCTLRSQREKFR